MTASTPALRKPRFDVLSIEQLGREGVEEVLGRAESFVEVLNRPNPKVPALRGKTIVNLFFEASTRTRTSFELAGKLLSADVINFAASGSSVEKGESVRDTAQTIASMGFDAIVVRHNRAGVAKQITQWVDAAVINAGDGNHQHPSQALLDALTLRQALGRNSFDGLRLTLVGDIANSRVARSAIDIFSMFGAEISLVAPSTMMPVSAAQLPGVSNVSFDLDEMLPKSDVIYTIRPKHERIQEALIPSMDEYITRYCITNARFGRLADDVLLMESGPLIRGVQMVDAVADSDRNLMNRQVHNGVAVRMALLFLALHEPGASV
jgi:aspartate carbamoyltransferase catalytic subunit